MTFSSASFLQPTLHNFAASNLASSRSITCMESSKMRPLSDPAFAGAIASKLYPASMLPTILEVYFRTKNEMECPRGAVVGFCAQVATIIITIPVISFAKSSSARVASILEIDWLHFLEAFMFWSSIHVQCTSFRQSVRAVERQEPLPRSALEYLPMAVKLVILFCSAFVVGVGHYFANPTSWHQVELFGGFGNKKTLLPGEVSLLTWIFHWSMVFDFFVLLRCMWKWGDATGNCKWKLYAQLHVPACIINAIVVINHLHRDRILLLKVLHPVLVFVSSIATLNGSYAIVRGKGWSMLRNNQKDNGEKRSWPSLLIPAESQHFTRKKNGDWDVKYTLTSLAVGAAFALLSTHLTV